MLDPAVFTVASARDALVRFQLFPDACSLADLGLIEDALQAEVADGHAVEPLASYGNGDYVLSWSYPGWTKPPVIVEVTKRGDASVIAPSPLAYLRQLAAHWGAEPDDEEEDEEQVHARNTLAAWVGPPSELASSEAYKEQLAGHPDFASALVPYADDVQDFRPSWANGVFAPVWPLLQSSRHEEAERLTREILAAGGATRDDKVFLAREWSFRSPRLAADLFLDVGDVASAVAQLFRVDEELGMQLAMPKVAELPPDQPMAFNEQIPALREAFEQLHRPWLHLIKPSHRTSADLNHLQGCVKTWRSYPRTAAMLRIAAAELAIALSRFEVAERMLREGALPDLESRFAALRSTARGASSRDPAAHMASLLAAIHTRDKPERGRALVRLGFTLCTMGRASEAVEHLENSALFLGSRYEHMDLIIDAVELLYDKKPLPESMIATMRSVLVDW